MMKTCVLCHLQDIPDGGSKGFSISANAAYAEIILIRQGSSVVAYRNRCPHTGAPMEWQANQFLDFRGTHIICGIHGARFRIRDGYCIVGPCIGRFLTKVLVDVENGWVVSSKNLDAPRG